VRRSRSSSGKPRHYLWIVVNILACASWFAIANYRDEVAASGCLSHLGDTATACMVYSMDYDGGMPPPARWMDATLPYVHGMRSFECPLRKPHDGQFGHALADNMAGANLRRINDLANTPMIVDSDNLFWNAVSENRQLTLKNGQPVHAAFLDGSAGNLRDRK
jgi:hypothetical protein